MDMFELFKQILDIRPVTCIQTYHRHDWISRTIEPQLTISTYVGYAQSSRGENEDIPFPEKSCNWRARIMKPHLFC